MQSTERLVDLIHKKHHVLVQLREVGQRQTDLVSSGDIASLLKLLAAKQQLISALHGLERELTPYYAEDPERRQWHSPQDRAQCAQQAAECNALLEDIVRLEKLGAEKMIVRRNEVAEQLQQVHAATQVRSAYEAQRRTRV
jgi:flagellar biosynthesis/type III secretory pathway chaperone